MTKRKEFSAMPGTKLSQRTYLLQKRMPAIGWSVLWLTPRARATGWGSGSKHLCTACKAFIVFYVDYFSVGIRNKNNYMLKTRAFNKGVKNILSQGLDKPGYRRYVWSTKRAFLNFTWQRRLLFFSSEFVYFSLFLLFRMCIFICSRYSNSVCKLHSFSLITFDSLLLTYNILPIL